MIETKEYPDNNKIVVSEITVAYTQENEHSTDEFNNLELSISTTGGGFYFVIKTERWAFDDINQLIEVLNDFKEKAKI